VSDAIVTIAAHRCLSRAAWLNSCRVAPHHCSMSSDHSRWGRPLLFEPSIIPNTRVFILLLSPILQTWPKRRSFLCITFCSRVSANWIFLYSSSLMTFCVHPILRILTENCGNFFYPNPSFGGLRSFKVIDGGLNFSTVGGPIKTVT